jgi:hypothetical protein
MPEESFRGLAGFRQVLPERSEMARRGGDDRRNVPKVVSVGIILNLLKIAESFPRQLDRLALYMQPALIEDRPQQPRPRAPRTVAGVFVRDALGRQDYTVGP